MKRPLLKLGCALVLAYAAALWLVARAAKPMTPPPNPFGTPDGPHGLVYPCSAPIPPGCSGLHWVPCIPSPSQSCGDAYDGPQVFSTDPFTVMIGFRSCYNRPPAQRYSGCGGFLPDYVQNAFAAREPEIDAGCVMPPPPNNPRQGCTYPHAWYSWDYIEPGAQAIFLQIQNVISSDPGFQEKCSETQDQWVKEFYGVPYTGPNVCPGVTPTTPSPTQTPCPTGPFGGAQCATTTPTVTPTVSIFSPTPTRTPTPTLTPPSPIPTPSCVANATSLCVQNRFRVSMTFGAGSQATATPLSGTDGGYFWFFQSSNPEVFVKVLNGCPNNGHWWFYAAGLTNVQTAITVTDTKTGESNLYAQPPNVPFVAVQDVKAFVCP